MVGEPGVAVKTASLEGLAEIPPSSLSGTVNAGGGTVLAYKYLGAQGAAETEWKLEVATELVESWVRAEVANLVSVSETVVSGRALVRYDIQNAPVKEFRLKIPASYSNVEITGENIRRRDQDGAEWRVELQNKVRGTFLLSVTWEQPVNLKSNALEVAGAQALGVERETGTVMVKAKSPLQALEKSINGELIKIDAREIPDWVSACVGSSLISGEAAVLAYRYTHPGYTLCVEARRFEDAAVLQALVDQARFTSVISGDGQAMTEMSLSVRNNGLQHLEIELPAGAQVWSAFVGGQPVRPAKREGKLLVPLENSMMDPDAPVSIELTYVGQEKFPTGQGKVSLASPKFDVPLKNARWDLYLPPDYDYAGFGGSMTHIVETAPLVQAYSLAEYRVQEAEKKASRKAAFKVAVSNAQKQLAEGDLRSFNNSFSQIQADSGIEDDQPSAI